MLAIGREIHAVDAVGVLSEHFRHAKRTENLVRQLHAAPPDIPLGINFTRAVAGKFLWLRTGGGDWGVFQENGEGSVGLADALQEDLVSL